MTIVLFGILGLSVAQFVIVSLAGILFATLAVWPLRLWFVRRAVLARAARCESFLQHLQVKALEKRGKVLTVLNDAVQDIFSGSQMEVRHLMSTSVETVSPTTSVEDLAATMAKYGVRHLPVCKGYGQLIGIVSDRDLRMRNGIVAQDIMSRRPITVTPLTPVAEAIETMLNNGVNCLPVTRGDHLCGLITTTDVMLALHCTLDILRRLAEELRTTVPMPEHRPTTQLEPSGMAVVD